MGPPSAALKVGPSHRDGRVGLNRYNQHLDIQSMQPSGLKIWFIALRPKTLIAAFSPVLLGTTAAWAVGEFYWLPTLLCLGFALLVQIGTNWANDYYDFIKGSDTEERLGPTRVVAVGWVAPKVMRRAMMIAFALAFLLGLGLLPYGGWPLLVIGIVAILCGIAYTGGPYPLGYNGWGDVCVFIFFGWVAVNTTFALQAQAFSLDAFIISHVPAALASNLLVVNNYRDAETDAKSGKRTLAVLYGRSFVGYEYCLLNAIALLVPLALWVRGWSIWVLLPWVLIPLTFSLCRGLFRADSKEAFASIFAGTGKLLLLHTLLLFFGIVLGGGV